MEVPNCAIQAVTTLPSSAAALARRSSASGEVLPAYSTSMAVTAGLFSGSAARASSTEAITFRSQVLYGPRMSRASSSMPMITISPLVTPGCWYSQSWAHLSTRNRAPQPMMAVASSAAARAIRYGWAFLMMLRAFSTIIPYSSFPARRRRCFGDRFPGLPNRSQTGRLFVTDWVCGGADPRFHSNGFPMKTPSLLSMVTS